MTIMMEHKGSRCVSRDELLEIKTPERTKTHLPIPHHEILEVAEDMMSKFNYEFSDYTLLVSKDNQMFMGSCTVKSPLWVSNGIGETEDYLHSTDDYDFKIAFTNSHNKTLPVKFFAGTHVFVCTNGQWDADVMISRKHTPGAWADIYIKLRELVFDMSDIRKKVINKFESLKEIDFDSKREVHDFLVQSCERRILPWQQAPKVLEHWNNPEHTEFNDRNGYSLFNAYTSNWRSGNPFDLSSKTQRLRGFIDEFKGIQNISSN